MRDGSELDYITCRVSADAVNLEGSKDATGTPSSFSGTALSVVDVCRGIGPSSQIALTHRGQRLADVFFFDGFESCLSCEYYAAQAIVVSNVRCREPELFETLVLATSQYSHDPQKL